MIAWIAARQHGVVAAVQLFEAGLDKSAIARAVAAGRLHRLYRGVYAVGHRGLSREGRWTIRVHACRTLDPLDVTTRRGIPVTSVARMFVDLTDVLTPHQLANVMHEAAYRKRFSVAATRAAMERANGRHNLHVLEKALALNASGSAGTKSPHEDEFLTLLQFAGIPEPLVNTRLLGEEIDCHWPDRRLVVEIDGPGHGRKRSRREDAGRDAMLRAAGYTVLRFTDQDIEHRPDEVLARVKRAL